MISTLDSIVAVVDFLVFCHVDDDVCCLPEGHDGPCCPLTTQGG